MLEKFDSLIGRLIQARQRGLLVNGQENEGIESLDTAYQIQEKVLEGLGSESIFWKVGSTSIEAQKKLGTDEPGSCRVPEKYCFLTVIKYQYLTHTMFGLRENLGFD